MNKNKRASPTTAIMRPEELKLFSQFPASHPLQPLLCFAPWCPSLDLMPVLNTILGKYRPAELICFPHHWFATSPLSFSLSDWGSPEAERRGEPSCCQAGPAGPRAVTRISRRPFWQIAGRSRISARTDEQQTRWFREHTNKLNTHKHIFLVCVYNKFYMFVCFSGGHFLESLSIECW